MYMYVYMYMDDSPKIPQTSEWLILTKLIPCSRPPVRRRLWKWSTWWTRICLYKNIYCFFVMDFSYGYAATTRFALMCVEICCSFAKRCGINMLSHSDNEHDLVLFLFENNFFQDVWTGELCSIIWFTSIVDVCLFVSTKPGLSLTLFWFFEERCKFFIYLHGRKCENEAASEDVHYI